MHLKKNKSKLGLAVALCLTLGLLPYFPEPHIWGKLKWIAGGAEGMGIMDYFDTVLHGFPWVFLVIMIVKTIVKK
ncbi:hypothetical protein [Ekhidna sp.]|uniref:hypothetical protein n=1 Tax=Ekhidna sp. TaxID=2608089 RepID=UPI003B500ADC